MPIKTTEDLHDCAAGLDQRPPADIAALLAHGQVAAAAAVQAAIPAICTGAEAMARTIASGGSLHYAAAGSSGLMAAADAQELGGTFSIPPEQVHIHMAGGLPSGVEMPGGTEDEIDGLSQSMAGITDQDCVIAVSASGTTPYTLAATRLAKSKGAAAIGIANNGGSALLEMVDLGK